MMSISSFSPGRRFIESLALWLRQFETKEERRLAYDFVRERLIFISNAENAPLGGARVSYNY